MVDQQARVLQTSAQQLVLLADALQLDALAVQLHIRHLQVLLRLEPQRLGPLQLGLLLQQLARTLNQQPLDL